MSSIQFIIYVSIGLLCLSVVFVLVILKELEPMTNTLCKCLPSDFQQFCFQQETFP